MTWISVKDRLPKDYQIIWVCWKGQDVVPGRYYENLADKEPESGFYSFEDDKARWATHWMPMQKPEMPLSPTNQ